MSCSLQKLSLCVRRGATVGVPIRLESSTWQYASISAIAQSAPVRITATAHGIPDGWRVAVMNVVGMTELNVGGNPPKDHELRRVRAVDADTVEINDVNAAGFRAYNSGGQLAWYAPHDLSAYEGARMQVRNKIGGTLLAEFTTLAGTLEIDTSNASLWLKLTEAQSKALLFKSGVFDIEMLRVGGDVDAICSNDSTLTVLAEVTEEAP
jgi:hypothetical protein